MGHFLNKYTHETDEQTLYSYLGRDVSILGIVSACLIDSQKVGSSFVQGMA